MLKRLFTSFGFNASGALISDLGFDTGDLIITVATLLIVLGVSIANEKGISVREKLAGTKPVVRWAVLYALIMFIVIFGAYGIGYVPVDPIYANF